jgi:membrane protease YdiL (CAAX protease family)
VGAIITTYLYQGREGLKGLLKRGIMVRLGRWWWIILLTFPVLIGGSLGLSVLLGNPVPALTALAQPLALPIALVWIFFLGGPLQEEFGWRGYAFENLRGKMSAINAAIAVGVLWSLWHLPLFFVPKEEFYYNRPAWGLFLTLILVGIILAWFYANTNGSVFAAMLGHAMFNWSNFVFPTLGSDSAALILFAGYFLLVAFILWQFRPKTLTRERSTNES